MKNASIIVLAIAVVITIAYFIGVHQGSQNAKDDIRVKQLKYQYDSLEKILIVSAFRQRQMNDTIAKRDAHIDALKKDLINSNFRIQRINQSYEKQIYSLSGASDSTLDAFFRARYLDSIAERSHR